MLYKPAAESSQIRAEGCQDEDRCFQPMTLKQMDRFFGEIASMDELAVLWPARNTIGCGQ
jgi:hypothetical protein